MRYNPDAPTVFIYGYHGMGNFGDDLFLHVINCELLKHVRLNVILKIGDQPPPPLNCAAVEYVRSPLFLKRLFWLKTIPHLTRSDHLIFCAGSLFRSQAFGLMLFAVLLARVMGKEPLRVCAVGVSVGPFLRASDRRRFRRLASFMDPFAVRDPNSRSHVRPTTGRHVGDIAVPFLVEYFRPHRAAASAVPRSGSPVRLGISATDDLFKRPAFGATLADMVADTMRRDERATLTLIVACTSHAEGDTAATDTFLSRLGTLKTRTRVLSHNSADVTEVLGEIRHLDALVSCRMHIALAGIIAGVPTIQLNYAEKVSAVFSDLEIPGASFPAEGDFLKHVAQLLHGERSLFLGFSADRAHEYAVAQTQVWAELRQQCATH